MRYFLLISILLVGIKCEFYAKTPKIELEFINAVEYPTTEENMIIGISGLAYDKDKEILYALSDEGGMPERPFYLKRLGDTIVEKHAAYGKNEVARFYKIPIILDVHGDSEELMLGNPQRFNFSDENGVVEPSFSYDMEALALLDNGNMLVSSERYSSSALDYLLYVNPRFFEFDLEGQKVHEYELPSRYFTYQRWPFRNTGPVLNNVFEGITAIPGEEGLYAGLMERALYEDQKSHVARFMLFKLNRDKSEVEEVLEYGYPLDTYEDLPSWVVQGVDKFKIENGASELLAIDDKTFLALERNYIPGRKSSKETPVDVLHLYQISIDQENAPTDILNVDKIKTREQVVLLEKELVKDFTVFEYMPGKFLHYHNLEGMCWGPPIDGFRTLIIANDNGSDLPKKRPEQTLFLFFKTNIPT